MPFLISMKINLPETFLPRSHRDAEKTFYFFLRDSVSLWLDSETQPAK